MYSVYEKQTRKLMQNSTAAVVTLEALKVISLADRKLFDQPHSIAAKSGEPNQLSSES